MPWSQLGPPALAHCEVWELSAALQADLSGLAAAFSNTGAPKLHHPNIPVTNPALRVLSLGRTVFHMSKWLRLLACIKTEQIITPKGSQTSNLLQFISSAAESTQELDFTKKPRLAGPALAGTIADEPRTGTQ